MILAHHMGEDLLPLLAGAVGVVPAFAVVLRARLGRLRRRLRHRSHGERRAIARH
jgi:hypothetical protein